MASPIPGFGALGPQKITPPIAAKKDSGPHQLIWPGRQIAPDCTLEFRVIFRGISMNEIGTPVRSDTLLLPIPTKRESLEVAVLLGSSTMAIDYPRYGDASTHLLNEGRLSNGERVWVVYYTTPLNSDGGAQKHLGTPDKFYLDPTLDLAKVSSMRAAVYGVQDDGHLAFFDMSVKVTPRSN
jgi:hypothetical protein